MTFPAHADITGKPRVVDGDTLVISGERIRLHGIDSPETRQTCTNDGKASKCGREATAALVTRIGARAVYKLRLKQDLLNVSMGLQV
jgi:endonuclease YncB( thermonuclease family)